METKQNKPMPSIKSDADAVSFVEKTDLTQFDLSAFKPTRFEFEQKLKYVSFTTNAEEKS